MGAGQGPALSGSPVILIVDDEEVMREVCSIMIADAGGQPLTAVDGRHGVEMFRAHAATIDCVVIDFSMPGMDGYRASMELRKQRPDLPIVFMSGLKRTPEIESLCRGETVEFIGKPFRARSLIEAINRVIQRAAHVSEDIR